jgi:hypothetical protein
MERTQSRQTVFSADLPAAADGDLTRAEPKPALQDLAHRRPADTQQATTQTENLPNLAMGHRDSHRLNPPQRPAQAPMSHAKLSPPINSGTGGPPATRPANRATVIPKF